MPESRITRIAVAICKDSEARVTGMGFLLPFRWHSRALLAGASGGIYRAVPSRPVSTALAYSIFCAGAMAAAVVETGAVLCHREIVCHLVNPHGVVDGCSPLALFGFDFNSTCVLSCSIA